MSSAQRAPTMSRAAERSLTRYMTDVVVKWSRFIEKSMISAESKSSPRATENSAVVPAAPVSFPTAVS